MAENEYPGDDEERKKKRRARARLTEMDTREVSVVDRAANRRRFLVVKQEDEMADEITGAEVEETQDGELTTTDAGSESADAGSGDAGEAAQAEGEPEGTEKADAPIPGPVKQAAQRIATEATERLMSLVNGLKAQKEKPVSTQQANEMKAIATLVTRLVTRYGYPSAGMAKLDDDGIAEEVGKVQATTLRRATEALERLMSAANRIKAMPAGPAGQKGSLPNDLVRELKTIATLLGSVAQRYPAAKADGDPSAEFDIEDMQAQFMVEELIEKAGKKISSSRLGKLRAAFEAHKKAYESIEELLKELDDDDDKEKGTMSTKKDEAGAAGEATQESQKTEEQGGAGTQATAQASGAQAAAAQDPAEVNPEIQKRDDEIKELKERVEKLEKLVPGGNAEGEPKKEPTKKSEEGVFSNLLHFRE